VSLRQSLIRFHNYRRVSELVEIQPVLRDQVPVVRRFSGGGTVIVDEGTVFVTFICNKATVGGLQPFPRDIMTWTGQLYGKVFDGFGEFHLRENGRLKK
jgi:lipoate-protein ligase A